MKTDEGQLLIDALSHNFYQKYENNIDDGQEEQAEDNKNSEEQLGYYMYLQSVENTIKKENIDDDKNLKTALRYWFYKYNNEVLMHRSKRNKDEDTKKIVRNV